MELWNGHEETAALLKEGHMAVAKADDWPAMPPERGARRAAAPKRVSRRLCRAPQLPVILGADPGACIISVHKHRADARDWRWLPPDEIVGYFEDLEASTRAASQRLYAGSVRRSPDDARQFEGLMAAVAVGTLQACTETSYWAPWPGDAAAVECRDVRSPISRAWTSTPSLAALEATNDGNTRLEVCMDRSALDICVDLALEPGLPRIGVVRFVAAGDARAASMPALGDFRSCGLALRSTYLEALLAMPRHLHMDPTKLLESGAVISTADITVVRGPVEAGAFWLAEPALVQVFTVALQRHPRCDEQGQYARTAEKAQAAEAIDRVFACAAAQGIDALVFSPPGVGGASSCHHPAADAGDLLGKAIRAHAKFIPRVWVCQDYIGQVSGWIEFAAAVERGRHPVEHRGLVPLAASPCIRPGWGQSPPRTPKFGSRGASPPGRRREPVAAETPRGASASSGSRALGTAGRAIAC